MTRIRRLLATVAASAALLLGTVIALEALGLLFHKESPEPAIANVHIRDVPEETAPARLFERLDAQERAEAKTREERAAAERAAEEKAQEEQRHREAERRAAAAAAEEARRREAEKAAEMKVAALVPPPVPDAPPEVSEVQVQPAPQETARTVKLVPSAGPERAGRTVDRAAVRRKRVRAVRRTAPRCPFLAWLETVMGPPPA